MEIAHRRLNEAENDVEVVDHEVEDDIDVESARREDAQAVRFEKHGPVEPVLDGAHGRVEAFEMANGQDAFVFFGESEEIGGWAWSVSLMATRMRQIVYLSTIACSQQLSI